MKILQSMESVQLKCARMYVRINFHGVDIFTTPPPASAFEEKIIGIRGICNCREKGVGRK